VGAHLDIIGWLLTALVFSTGLLVGRVHASIDATKKLANDVSWQIRSALSEGTALDVSDLRALVRSTRPESDLIARATRIMNWVVLVAATAVYADALRILRGQSDHPTDAWFLASTLLLASILVTVLGDFDVARTRDELQRSLADTTIGRLQVLDRAIAERRLDDAVEVLGYLRASYPDWTLVADVALVVQYLRGQDVGVPAQIDHGADTPSWLRVSVVAASALQSNRLDLATREFTQRMTLPKGPQMEVVGDALALCSAHLEIVVGSEEVMSITPHVSSRSSTSSLAALHVSEVNAESMSEVIHVTGLPAAPDYFDELRQATAFAAAWEGDGDAQFPSYPCTLEVVEAVALRTQPVSALEELTDPLLDPGANEMVGLLYLVNGQPRSALRCLEAAVTSTPSSARFHWMLGLTYESLGWRDRAEGSRERAATLEPEHPLYHLDLSPATVETPSAVLLRTLSRLELLQLELLGHPVLDIPTAQSRRDRFVAALLEQVRRAEWRNLADRSNVVSRGPEGSS
jgi:hypothetical protein